MKFHLGKGLSPDVSLKRILERFHTPANEDLMIVLGGDGTMLQAVKEYGSSMVYLGLNFGTVGFLMNEIGEDQVQLIDAIEHGEWDTFQFPRLQMETNTRCTDLALNDVYAERASGQTAHLNISVNGEEVVERLICDGVIVATALGSTAYNVSVGGPTSHPFVPAMYLTPIAPHTPRLRPVVLPLDREVVIRSLGMRGQRPVRALADGRNEGDNIEWVKISQAPEQISLAFFKGHSFTRTLVQKILLS